MVGRSLKIWPSGMGMADTWSDVSLGSSGMAIVVVQNQRTYLLLFAIYGIRSIGIRRAGASSAVSCNRLVSNIYIPHRG